MDVTRDPGQAWAFEPLPGGWSGETFLAGAGEERTVVRIYARPRTSGAAAAEVDAALMRLLRGLVPVPEVLEVRPAEEDRPPLLVTRYVPGARADDVVRDATGPVLSVVGEQAGRLAGTLAGIATLGPGRFTDESLQVEPFDEDEQDLPAYVTAVAGRLRGFDAAALGRLEDLAWEAQGVLDEVGRTCLVHGDLSPRNLVLDPVTHAVRAVVDFEHAHSGVPHADLGSLLRFDRHPEWEEAVLSGWSRVRGEDPSIARHRARCADLLALVELAARPGGNLVVDLAELFLAEVVRTGDLHAHP